MSYTFAVQTEEKGAATVDNPRKPGYWSGGTGILAGPIFSDRDRTRRSPSPPEVVELYRSIVYICCRINFNAFSKIRLKLYATTKGGQSRVRLLSHETDGVNPFQKRYIKSVGHLAPYTRGIQEIEEVTEHPLLHAVMHPNPRWDHVRLMRYVSLCLDLFGRSHWWMENFENVRIQNVWPLLSQFMYPQKGGGYELVEFFRYGTENFPYHEIMEVMEPSARDPYALGVSPEEATFAHSDLFDMFVSYERNIFEQGAAPRLLISNKDQDAPLGRAERERLQRDINYSLVRGAQGMAWVVDGSLDVTPVSFLPEGMAKLNIGNESMQRVANAFGVPVSMVDIGNSNRAVSETDKRNHAENAIDPKCALVASAMTKWTRQQGKMIDGRLKAAGSRVTSGFDRLVWAFDNPIPEDEVQRTKIVDMKIRNGTWTINMALASEGLPPVPWGDEPWQQGQLIQPGIAEELRKQGQVGRDGKPRNGAVTSNKPPKPALPKPADDELEEGKDEEVVKPPKKALDPPKRKVPARFAEEWDLAEALVRQALLDIGLGHEERYEDEVITQEQRLEALGALRVNSAALMRKLGEQTLEAVQDAQDEEEKKAFGKKAKEKLVKFFRDGRKFIKASVLATALLVFGPGEPTSAEIKAIEEATARQVEYMEGFKEDTFAGRQLMDGDFPARAEKYGLSLWGEGGNMLRGAAIRSKIFEEEARFHVGEDFPCKTCVEQEDLGWQPIGTLKKIGESECKMGCHCHYEFKDVNGNVWLAGRGPLDELAFGRTG